MEKTYNKNGKNIQQKYNEITDHSKRLVKSKVGNIEYVLNNMLDDYPKAKELAKDELKTAKLNS